VASPLMPNTVKRRNKRWKNLDPQKQILLFSSLFWYLHQRYVISDQALYAKNNQTRDEDDRYLVSMHFMIITSITNLSDGEN
jgi:hypothetical protein